jgi:uncharacterized protein YndB with AHSA1/START domain
MLSGERAPAQEEPAVSGVGHSESVRVAIDAPASLVYRLVSDPTRMPEWSPEVVRVVWQAGHDTAEVGARFRGTSRARLRWSRTCEVLAAEPGRFFVFRTVPAWPYRDSTVWSFDIEPTPHGCLLTERYEILRGPNLLLRLAARLNARPSHLAPHLTSTLTRLKATAEQPLGTTP